jgi:hypothetical protein
MSNIIGIAVFAAGYGFIIWWAATIGNRHG